MKQHELHLIFFFRFSTIENAVTTEEPEGHSGFAVNDIAEHNKIK